MLGSKRRRSSKPNQSRFRRRNRSRMGGRNQEQNKDWIIILLGVLILGGALQKESRCNLLERNKTSSSPTLSQPLTVSLIYPPLPFCSTPTTAPNCQRRLQPPVNHPYDLRIGRAQITIRQISTFLQKLLVTSPVMSCKYNTPKNSRKTSESKDAISEI